MKKFLSILCISTLSLSLFSACDNSDVGTTEKDSTTFSKSTSQRELNKDNDNSFSIKKLFNAFIDENETDYESTTEYHISPETVTDKDSAEPIEPPSYNSIIDDPDVQEVAIKFFSSAMAIGQNSDKLDSYSQNEISNLQSDLQELQTIASDPAMLKKNIDKIKNIDAKLRDIAARNNITIKEFTLNDLMPDTSPSATPFDTPSSSGSDSYIDYETKEAAAKFFSSAMAIGQNANKLDYYSMEEITALQSELEEIQRLASDPASLKANINKVKNVDAKLRTLAARNNITIKEFTASDLGM